MPSTSASARASNAAAQRLNRSARNCLLSPTLSVAADRGAARSTRRWRFSATCICRAARRDRSKDRQGNRRRRLRFLVDVGLDYLTLGTQGRQPVGRRSAAHPPGFADRRGPGGCPVRARRTVDRSHQRDNDDCMLRSLACVISANTVIVVEHDEDAIRLADHIVDIGPGARAFMAAR